MIIISQLTGHIDSLSQRHGLLGLLSGTEPEFLSVISNTCAFPCMATQSVCAVLFGIADKNIVLPCWQS